MSRQINRILDGIDKDECDYEGGWWPTSKGVEFGTQKLKEVNGFVGELYGIIYDIFDDDKVNSICAARERLAEFFEKYEEDED